MTSRLIFILLLATCVLLITLLLSVNANFREYVDQFREQQSVEIYLHSSDSAPQIEPIIAIVSALPGYKDFKLEDKKTAFKRMQSLLGDQLLPDDATNPFPDRIIVRFSAEYANIESFRKAAGSLRVVPAVDTVTFNAEWIDAQEEAFARWESVILGALLLSAIATLFALVMGVAHTTVENRSLLTALQIHGAGFGLFVSKFAARWAGLALLATLLGIGVAYALWRLFRSTYASDLFVAPHELILLSAGAVTLTLVGLFIKMLRYR
jgi:cell division protein FtsX